MEENTLAGEVMQPFENLAETGLPTKTVELTGFCCNLLMSCRKILRN